MPVSMSSEGYELTSQVKSDNPAHVQAEKDVFDLTQVQTGGSAINKAKTVVSQLHSDEAWKLRR